MEVKKRKMTGETWWNLSQIKSKLRNKLIFTKIKLGLTFNPDGMVRKYLQEWRDEQEYATKNGMDPKFSWHWHDKELLSIQGAIRDAYERSCARPRTSLTEEERNEIELILRCEID